MTLSQEASLSERYNYAPHMIAAQEVLDALLELEAWRDAAYSGKEAVTEPEELEKRIATLEEITPCPYDYEDLTTRLEILEEITPCPYDYEDLKSFFLDCVNSLDGNWPAPDASDNNLRNVIFEAIAKGDTK